MRTYYCTMSMAVLIIMILVNCEKDKQGNENSIINTEGETVASYQVAKEDMLRLIPEEYIKAVRNNLHIAYQHTSHGTHVSRGMFGLPDYKSGDAVLFGITNNHPQSDKLDFRDLVLQDYAEPGTSAVDLSADETAFIQATRNYLNDPENAEINVIIWSWCSINGHNVTGNYLPGMQALIYEYGPGGSQVGTGPGQREHAVTFIFMTGHAEAGNNVGSGKPMNQADTIIGYCQVKKYFCLDYYGIDTHDMDDHYWEDAGDNGDSDDYGGNFYADWQQAHQLGIDYYENKVEPGGNEEYGAHNTQHITANRKAYAMWWILARIAGWDGKTE